MNKDIKILVLKEIEDSKTFIGDFIGFSIKNKFYLYNKKSGLFYSYNRKSKISTIIFFCKQLLAYKTLLNFLEYLHEQLLLPQ